MTDDLKCWMCNSLGAVVAVTGEPTWRPAVWVPFKPEPGRHIRLDRDEHVCPACKGSGNPRKRTS